MPGEVPAFPGLQGQWDTTPARWLVDRLRERQESDRLSVGAVVPDVYPSYGRLLHPARSALPGDPGEIRWSTIAAKRGIPIDGSTRFRELADWHDGPDPPPPYSAPLRGSLDEGQCIALAEVLAGFTSQSQAIWYLLWDGYGSPELPAPGQGPPRVHLGHEDCLLFTGPLTACTSFRSENWFQSPTVWWPDDRAWCVSTPVDGFSTYIGGSEPCLNVLVSEPRLEVFPVKADQPVDPSPYPA
jgi:hypothetical protein